MYEGVCSRSMVGVYVCSIAGVARLAGVGSIAGVARCMWTVVLTRCVVVCDPLPLP